VQPLDTLARYLAFACAWLQPVRPSSLALVLEWSGIPSHRFVHPGCTVTPTESQAGRDAHFKLSNSWEKGYVAS
jgi:hypothetical protein